MLAAILVMITILPGMYFNFWYPLWFVLGALSWSMMSTIGLGVCGVPFCERCRHTVGKDATERNQQNEGNSGI